MKRLGITMGDANGVGPEIVLKTAAAGKLPWGSMVFGDESVLAQCAERLGISAEFEVRDLAMMRQAEPGVLSRVSGAAARAYVEAATRAALVNEVDAVVTLPVNKEAVQLSDASFVGHTEFIAALCGAEKVTMMLASDQLIVTHVSTHVSLQEAIRRTKTARIQDVIALTQEATMRLRGQARIAVAGLNPHAGEHGLFGEEDAREIAPAVAWARARGWNVEGPLPPDTLFYLAVRRQQYDAIVCMYHDQGHVPMKLLDFEGAVNVTLGLPIVRTSVDHGTAFDIAWQGKASTESFERALAMAESLVG